MKKEDMFLKTIKELCVGLVLQNNIEGYDNYKKYSIILNCSKNNDLNIYKITIEQGTHNKKIIATKFINTNKDLSNDIDKMILNLINTENFLYTSFSESLSKLEYASFNLIFNNDIELKMIINTKEELNRYKKIKELSKENPIIKPQKIEKYDNDKLQVKKANLKIKSAIILINFLKEKNYYSNYTTYLNNYYDEDRECYVYTIKIISNLNKEVIFTRNFSIINKNLIKNNLIELLNCFGQDEEYLYSASESKYKKEILTIITNNNVNLEVTYDNLDSEEKIYSKYKDSLDKKIIKIKKI